MIIEQEYGFKLYSCISLLVRFLSYLTKAIVLFRDYKGR